MEAIGSQHERLRANASTLTALLRLAEQLRRMNTSKWAVTREEWRAAVRDILAAPVPHPDDPDPVAKAIRSAQNIGLRLGNSGEARLGSASVGRHPDSSLAGRRFYDDLLSAEQHLAELQALALDSTQAKGA